MERPKKKFVIETNLSPEPDIINDCEVRRQGYNHSNDEWEKFLPSKREIEHLINLKIKELTLKHKNFDLLAQSELAKAISKRLGGEK